MTKILSNQVMCHICGDKPFSRHRHDYVSCGCGNIAVDGGMSYLRRTGNFDKVTDISIEIDDKTYSLLEEALTNERTNTLGKICEIARVLRDRDYWNFDRSPNSS